MAKKKVTFEQALDDLEQVVQQLEKGDLGLEEALKLFEQGVAMSRICSEHLNQAEKKIEYLLNPEIAESGQINDEQ